MKRIVLIALLALLVSAMLWRSQARAAPTKTVFKGGGWTLTLNSARTSYGQALSGSFTSRTRSFPVHGDWIPAGDAGGDLLRFYGHPFTPSFPMGLVGLATLYSTCQPNCAQARTYTLRGIAPFPRLPGVNRGILTLRIQG
jgi:hypothetical protein